jgi:arsenite methyltransferase
MFYKKFFGHDTLKEDKIYSWNDRQFIFKKGIPRELGVYTETQDQTKDAFSFKWNQLETYESEAVKKRSYDWLLDRYFGGKESAKQEFINKNKGCLFLDAGCGSGFSMLLLFGEYLNDFHYLGIDISESINVARARFEEKGIGGEFIQADIANLPAKEPIFDVIFSEGVLHHTDSTREALGKLVSLLRPGGSVLFYIYRKKGPIREFADDYIREKIRALSDEEAWEKLKSLTKLGKTLGDLNSQIIIDEDIDVLDIPKGEYDLQRFFYWHVAKLFYSPDYSLEEMNHINFDWYRPLNAHRQTPEEVRGWCEDFGLNILRLFAEEAGITVIARKN